MESLEKREVRVGVTDNGKGSAPEEIDKIFDPFYTTSPVGQGTGLGLSVSYSIVKQHFGSIEVEKRAGGRKLVLGAVAPDHLFGGKALRPAVNQTMECVAPSCPSGCSRPSPARGPAHGRKQTLDTHRGRRT